VTRLVVLLGLSLLGTGCTASLLDSRNEAPEVFRLSGLQREHAGDPLPLALAVARPRAPASLDSERIALVQDGGRFDYVAGARWADPAPQMLQQMIVRVLAADGRFATVVSAPNRVPTDLALDVELRRFEAVYGPGQGPPVVRVEVQVTLVHARTARLVTSFLVEAEAGAAENRRSAVLEAFERATDEALAGIVERLRAASAGLQATAAGPCGAQPASMSSRCSRSA
jgi:cholesterol transport system auxiliary component